MRLFKAAPRFMPLLCASALAGAGCFGSRGKVVPAMADAGIAPVRVNAATAGSATAVTNALVKKQLDDLQTRALRRKRLAPRTLVFSRSQVKYGLHLNYYHTWIDRPLFVDRAYRVPSPFMTPEPSFKRILQEMALYDMDGMAFFPETSGRMGVFDLADRAGVPNVTVLPEFIPSRDLALKIKVLEKALACRSAQRLNGKLLITSYNAGELKPAEWKDVLTALRARFGDVFIFLPALTAGADLRGAFDAGAVIPDVELEGVKAYLRAYLDVCDGIYFHYPAAFRNIDRTFDAAFYRDLFIPLWKSVLAEPAYRNKYFGLSAYRAHMNPDRANSLHEDLTRTMRRSFEAAMDADPDVIVLPEWDECNENTCWRPTAYGGTASQRIVRYYMSRIRGKEPTPRPGDDASVPNLIFSTRKMATLGEDLVFEALNVPDGSPACVYSAEVELFDENGRRVACFEPVVIDSTRLQETRWRLATEASPEVRALVPAVTVKGYGGQGTQRFEGFHPVQLRATWNWDYLCVRQPLRDLIRPVKASLVREKGSDRPDGSFLLSGTVEAPEPLALVEVLGDDDEVYAVDPADEFFRNNPDREIVCIDYRAPGNKPLQLDGTVTLENAEADWFSFGNIKKMVKVPSGQPGIKKDVVKLNSQVSPHKRWIGLAVPSKDSTNANLVLTFDGIDVRWPLRDVFAQGMLGYAGDKGLTVTVSPYRRLPDMPAHLDRKDASFRTRVWPETAGELFHIRATAKSGRVYRSLPVVALPLGGDRPEGTRVLRVYSGRDRRGVDVRVAADRVPDLTYEFKPERGDVLLTSAGRPFWASMGGFVNASTGHGGSTDIIEGNALPETFGRTAPTWERDGEGHACLRFDGKATYLKLPREALPRLGAFTLELDVKPDEARDQILFINRIGHMQNSLALEVRKGKLYGSYRSVDLETHLFPTGLDVPAGTWSMIRVAYDFERIRLSVNGKEEAFPFNLYGCNLGCSLIGDGFGQRYKSQRMRFKGLLRGLRIRHGMAMD